MDATNAILTRSSALGLNLPAPNDQQVRGFIGAAVRAPDHGKLTPWRFVVLRGPSRDVLGDAMAVALRERNPLATAEELCNEHGKALRAPLVVVVAAALHSHKKIPQVEQSSAVAAAAQNFWLAAHAAGFGVMWKTGAAAYSDSVKIALGLAVSDQIIALLYVGTASARAPVRAADIDAVTRWL